MVFAEVSDIESRWHTLSASDRQRAEVLIGDASAMLEAAFACTIDVSDESQMQRLNIVCCNMVIRAMSATEVDSFGASNMSMTAGPYTQSWTYANPSGDMYITKAEKRMLGITSGYIGTIRPMMAGDHDD